MQSGQARWGAQEASSSRTAGDFDARHRKASHAHASCSGRRGCCNTARQVAIWLGVAITFVLGSLYVVQPVLLQYAQSAQSEAMRSRHLRRACVGAACHRHGIGLDLFVTERSRGGGGGGGGGAASSLGADHQPSNGGRVRGGAAGLVLEAGRDDAVHQGGGDEGAGTRASGQGGGNLAVQMAQEAELQSDGGDDTWRDQFAEQDGEGSVARQQGGVKDRDDRDTAPRTGGVNVDSHDGATQHGDTVDGDADAEHDTDDGGGANGGDDGVTVADSSGNGGSAETSVHVSSVESDVDRRSADEGGGDALGDGSDADGDAADADSSDVAADTTEAAAGDADGSDAADDSAEDAAGDADDAEDAAQRADADERSGDARAATEVRGGGLEDGDAASDDADDGGDDSDGGERSDAQRSRSGEDGEDGPAGDASEGTRAVGLGEDEGFRDGITGSALEGPEEPREVTGEDLEELGLGFATAAPGSLRYDDVAWCPGANEPARAALQTMRMPHKMLYILGPAATGARWLAEALATNETFVAPAYSHWPDTPRDQAHGVHLYDQWPQRARRTSDPTSAYPRARVLESFVRLRDNVTDPSVFLDATPEYMMTSAAAPRIKRMVPNARFVVVLRDPAPRALAAWQRLRDEACREPGSGGGGVCTFPSFESIVTREPGSSLTQGGCFFDDEAAVAEARKTWHECHRCRYSHVFLPACDGLFGKHLVDDTFTPCERARAGRGLDVSHAVIGAGQYAAQLAWWLSFFPADRFLLVTTHQLRDAAARVEVLNAVAAHMGVAQHATFAAAPPPALGAVQADTAAEALALDLLRARFKRPLRDLRALAGLVWPVADLSELGE